jgi:proline iminopeptidase
VKKKILKFVKWIFLILISAFIIRGCIPTIFDIPNTKPRDSTQYWILPTGSKIAYTHVEGKGNKKPFPIIYLHGGPGGYVHSKDIEVLGQLSEIGYDVYLYDQIGSGLSDRLQNVKEYTALRHKEDLEEIVKLLNVNKVILVGHSWGGVLAVMYAADNLNKVDKLIFPCPGTIKPKNKQLEEIKAPDSLNLKDPYDPTGEIIGTVLSPRYLSIRLWAHLFGKKLATDREADGYLNAMANKFTKGLVFDSTKVLKEEGGAGGYSNINTTASFGEIVDPRPKLKNNTIPVLVLKGQYDTGEWGYTKEYLDLFIRHKFKVIRNAGHQIFVEQPILYFEEMKSFLEE